VGRGIIKGNPESKIDWESPDQVRTKPQKASFQRNYDQKRGAKEVQKPVLNFLATSPTKNSPVLILVEDESVPRRPLTRCLSFD
jgi:hypothetical protein